MSLNPLTLYLAIASACAVMAFIEVHVLRFRVNRMAQELKTALENLTRKSP
jgi:hypothetical protein